MTNPSTIKDKDKERIIFDSILRPLRDLRISVTDRCNFRCLYCMPKEVYGKGYRFLPHSELLSFEEISHLVRIFNQLGTRKVRLTGGEPLLRHELHVLVKMLADIPNLEIALTTNGSLISRHARKLKKAGLDRVTISLDSLDDEVFKHINGVKFPVKKILDGIKAAEDAGFHPIKINMVVKRGLNEHLIVPMARYFINSPHIVRFIEYMDVGNTNGWQLKEVVPANEIIERINAELPIEPLEANYPGEVAKRWKYKHGEGEIGLIASVTQSFCGDCSRARLSAVGQLYTCLFAAEGHDLRNIIRNGTSDSEVKDRLIAIWHQRNDRYSETRFEVSKKKPKVEMSYIGG